MAHDTKADSTENAPDMQQQREKFYELLKSFNTVVLITQTASAGSAPRSGSFHDAEVHSRPMQIARVDENCDLWFLTDAESAKVIEIRSDPMVHIVAQDDRARFISLSGTASINRDKAVLHELWSESYKVWFTEGENDPSIRIIHVNAHEGEFWDSKGLNKVKYLLQAAKAYATGTRPEVDRGEQQGHVVL